MKTFRTIYLVLIVLTLSGMAAAQKGKPSPTPTPTPAVITAKFNYCAPGDTVCEAANRVHFGDAPGVAQLRADHPVLQRAQVRGVPG